MDIFTGTGTIDSVFDYDNFFLFRFESFFTPEIVYYVNFDRDPVTKIYYKEEIEGFDEKQFVSNQEFYSSKDGTEIPMFIIHKKVS